MDIDRAKKYSGGTNPFQSRIPADNTNNSAQVNETDRSAESDSNLKSQSAAALRREEEASAKMLHSAVETANKHLINANRTLLASVHEKTNRIQVKVICTETKEVVKEIPPEKTLDLFAKVLEMAGLLLDEHQ